MSKYDIFCPAGEKCCGIRTMEGNKVTYFGGYDFMGSVDWIEDMTKMVRYESFREAREIVEQLEAAD